MLFNSFAFLVFFVLVTGIYLALPHRFRWFHLLVSSCVFYGYYMPAYLLVLGSVIVIDYFAGLLIWNAQGPKRKAWLLMSLAANIGVLCFFKYYNFFAENINTLLHRGSDGSSSIPYLHLLLPMGLSFHTFQAMSYNIEVYRGNFQPERKMGFYALYIMFYPQLMAGPIERPADMLPQLHEEKSPGYDDISDGLRLLLWGLFKKAVIADRLAMVVDAVYAHPRGHSNMDVLLAAVLFSFQILCDFSGYTDMARGAARIMGFRLVRNFDQPFISRSITEFWRRWHISLSSWLNDYLYTPLSLNMRNLGKAGIIIAIAITFFISGLWHGAGWTFVMYGLLNGAAVIYELLTRKARKKIFAHVPVWLNNGLSIAITFCYASFTWIFFRAPTVRTAWHIAKRAAYGFRDIVLSLEGKPLHTVLPAKETGSALLLLAVLGISSALMQRAEQRAVGLQSRTVRWAFYYLLCLGIVFAGIFEHRQFIYFQF